MSSYAGEDFRKYKDHTTYFITEDALAPLSHDIAFSPTRKYYCAANCQVCYIKKKLVEHKPFYDQAVPEKITDAQTKSWYDIFSYFYVVRVVDDLKYLKQHYPHVYDWYREHAHTFEYGMTDNAIIQQHECLMELNMSGLSEITLSEEFMNRVNSKKNYNRIIEILQDYVDKYALHKVKIIKTTDSEFQYHAVELVDWLKDKNLILSLHNDYRNTSEELSDKGNVDFDLNGMFDYQNTQVLCHNDRTYQIYRGALHLYGDRFFYSIDDATDINWDPFHTMKEQFDHRSFMIDMLNGKLKLYKQFASELSTLNDAAARKFVDYYINTIERFVVSSDFNFIPKAMLNSDSVFYSKLASIGYVNTEVGLYYPGSKPQPIIQFK